MRTMTIEQYKANHFGKKPKTKPTKNAAKNKKTKRKTKSNDVDMFGFPKFNPPKIKLF